MENFNTQAFIQDARKQGVPDREIYNYLSARNAIPQDKQINPIGSEGSNDVVKKESIIKSIAADPFRTLIEKPATALGRVGALGIAEVADLVGKDERANAIRQAALEKPTESIIGGKEVAPIQNTADVVGQALSSAGYLIPGGKVAGALGGKLGGKVAAGALQGAAADIGQSLQDTGKVKLGAGTAFGVAGPIAGKGLSIAKNITGRLLKNVSAGLSGVKGDVIETIVKNPEQAQIASKQLKELGSSDLLKQNTKTIIDGVNKIKKQASTAYGEGLEQLSQQDIKPEVFRSNTQSFLDDFGVYTDKKTNQRVFSNIEFAEQPNIDKANKIVDLITNTDLDGKSINKTLKTVDTIV